MTSRCEYSKRNRDKRQAAGLCIGCGQVPPVLNKIRCQTCLDWFHRDYQSRVARGVCSVCGKDKEAGYRVCQVCRDKRKATYKNKKI